MFAKACIGKTSEEVRLTLEQYEFGRMGPLSCGFFFFL